VRVGELAREVALELGLDVATVADTVRAAHLHELGRIKLERDAPVTQRELALAGASVIHEAASMDRVARVVAAHGDLTGREAADETIALPARIVAACCEIDRYAPDPGEPGQRQEVVVRLVRDIGDLEVISALTRVLDRPER
jgi:HD superfamily phosphodiesterase